MQQNTQEYDLYLDESGDFMETSSDPKERLHSKSGKKKLPSQLAGLLVPRDSVDDAARTISDQTKKRARLLTSKPIHATEVLKGSRYQYLEMAEEVIKSVRRHHEWQPVRLVNLEQVSYGTRSSIYANLVAELVLRTFQEKSRFSPEAKICIRLVDPSYTPQDVDGPVKRLLRAEEYRKRIFEYLGFATVRYGLAAHQRNWRFDGIIGKAYKETPALQICDVLSNASHGDFHNLEQRPATQNLLRKMFGEFDFTLAIRELFERVDELAKEHSFGMALMILAESLVHATREDEDFSAKLEERLNHFIVRLSKMDYRGRDPQLALLVGWLDQLIGQQRLLDKGYDISHWLLENVEAPLRKELTNRRDEATLDWFAYSLRRWALTACNHNGVLLLGQAEMEAMQSLQPSVAKQWERIPLVMDGLIAQAVHYTDCFEFDKASKRMRFVADSLKLQSNRFHELMPADFPEQLRFDLRARALGTLVQSEIFAGATDPSRLQSARKASDETVAEFMSFSDRARQYQYRCHLETVARDFPTARRYLVRSLEGTGLDPAEYSHNKIADLIRNYSIDPEWKAEFGLVHWLRIGAYACLEAHREIGRRSLAKQTIAEGDQDITETERGAIESERDHFLEALDRSEQLDSNACQGRLLDYPSHSILRFVAVINAARGKWSDSLTALQRLHALDPIGKEQFVLAMILTAAQAEVTALLWEHDETKARALLDNSDLPFLGLKQMTQQIDETHQSRFAAVDALKRRLLGIVIHVTENQPQALNTKKALLELSATNVY